MAVAVPGWCTAALALVVDQLPVPQVVRVLIGRAAAVAPAAAAVADCLAALAVLVVVVQVAVVGQHPPMGMPLVQAVLVAVVGAV